MEFICTAFAAIFLLLGTASGLQYQERCRTPDRARGTCIGIRECPLFAEHLKVKPIPQATQDLLSRSQCGFQGRDPLVCCPSNSPVALQSTAITNTEVTEDVSRHRNLGLLKTDICGPIADDRIINGNRTKLNEMPWMALIAYNVQGGSPFGCGGTVINDRYVLTAAHCVKFLSRGVNPISVRLGEHDLDSEIDCEEDPDGKPEDKICAPKPQDIRIEEIVVHPRYTGKSDLQDDIALIRLSTAADFNSGSIKPVCLPIGLQQQTQILTNKKVIVTGWGITENATTSSVLLKVDALVMPHDQCANTYRGTVPISGVSQICAGGVKNGGDSCSGDSGGPITYFGQVRGSLRTIQQGVVSFGSKKCGSEGKPGVYTRVGHFMNWILDNLKP